MFCTNCGSVVGDTDKFCVNCGFQINKAKNNEPFYLLIEDTFRITGRGVVVTGCVQNSSIHPNDTIKIIDTNGEIIENGIRIKGIECERKMKDEALPGMNVGILLGYNLSTKDICKGYRLEQEK